MCGVRVVPFLRPSTSPSPSPSFSDSDLLDQSPRRIAPPFPLFDVSSLRVRRLHHFHSFSSTFSLLLYFCTLVHVACLIPVVAQSALCLCRSHACQHIGYGFHVELSRFLLHTTYIHTYSSCLLFWIGT